MESDYPLDALAALGHPGRVAVFRLLARRAPGGVRPSEIADALDTPRNTLSTHLAALERAGLVASARDGRAVRYRLDLDGVGGLVRFLVADCCRGRPELCAPLTLPRRVQGDAPTPDATPARPYNVLFICAGNSARSLFAEAILTREGGGRFTAHSAGAHPRREPNPFALEVLRRVGHDVSGLRAKSVDEFRTPDAPRMDFVFTVCDAAANEECPPWPGQPVTAHWGLPDPVRAEGTDAEKRLAFWTAYRTLRHRISAFAALPIRSLDALSLQRRLDEIGQEEAQTEPEAG